MRIAAALPAIAVVGLAARFGLPGAFGDWAGGIVYTAFAYALIAAARPAWAPRTVGLAAAALSAAIEFLQLVGVASALVDPWSPLRLAFGTSFVAADVIAYAIGAALAAAADARIIGRRAGG